VPKTLLAVDDSATMRKVLEITFAGEDFRVITAESPASAMSKMSEEPVAFVIDTLLADGGDGYALAKEVRSRDGRSAIVLLCSRHAPYDATRGKDAGVDDFIDKPFDSQAMIDKVKKALLARETGKATAPVVAAPVVNLAAASPATAPAAAPPITQTLPPFAAPRPPAVPLGVARPNFPTQRTHTLSFEGSPSAPSALAAPAPTQPMLPLSRTAPSAVPAVHAAPAAAPTQAFSPPAPQPVLSAPARAPDAPRRAPGAAPVAAAAVNGHLAGKLDELGLTPGQVEAVLALSREVVERVVWEVVPQLAEALIKEEILRITKDG
jgi:FixJ family two-component response regulator